MAKKHRVIQWNGEQIEDVPPEDVPPDWRKLQQRVEQPPMTKAEKADRNQNCLLLFTMSSVAMVFGLLALAAFCVIMYAIIASLF